MTTQRTTPASQTLSRGIRILEELAYAREPLTIDAIAERLEVHRSIAYRLLRTLELHGLAVRDAGGRVQLGARMATLAAGVAYDLHSEALPELTAVANDLAVTCFLAVRDHDECITLTSVEPRHAVASLAQRPGSRHSMLVGAPSKAILSALAPSRWPAGVDERLRDELAAAAEQGYATSHDEVIPTVRSVAVPLGLPANRDAAAIAVVYVGDHDEARIAARLQESARIIRSFLGG
ncbi:HTH domain-containing protein [Kocuria coralli]|uniref:HTH domain-containing protein n=1 Tax=Kocuria coralli TaxID=1461025 RepID=A0A5J5KXU7_9MICC|nr:helix-turn-helix domain-containing protein [Kocuria coralli]KAA9394474.1 HTH domain-containing protein [Kocuria coralli]